MSAKNLVDHYINYTWDKEVPYDFTKLTTAVIDIEVAADEGFPSVVDAEKPITAIAVKVRSQTIVYGWGDFTPKETNHHYAKCTDEKHLLLKFLDDWCFVKGMLIKCKEVPKGQDGVPFKDVFKTFKEIF